MVWVVELSQEPETVSNPSSLIVNAFKETEPIVKSYKSPLSGPYTYIQCAVFSVFTTLKDPLEELVITPVSAIIPPLEFSTVNLILLES